MLLSCAATPSETALAGLRARPPHCARPSAQRRPAGTTQCSPASRLPAEAQTCFPPLLLQHKQAHGTPSTSSECSTCRSFVKSSCKRVGRDSAAKQGSARPGQGDTGKQHPTKAAATQSRTYRAQRKTHRPDGPAQRDARTRSAVRSSSSPPASLLTSTSISSGVARACTFTATLSHH